MTLGTKKKIVVLGMMSRHPVAGMVFITVQYLVGFLRLGYDVYYVEPQGGGTGGNGLRPPTWIESVLRRFDLGDRWAYHDIHEGRCYGLSEIELRRLYQSAALIINLHGSTKPMPELYATDRLLYLETDPVEFEISLYEKEQWVYDFMAPHCAFFTWGENYGGPGCKLPVPEQFLFRPTRQPVVIDLWESFGQGVGRPSLTTIGNWRQDYREVTFLGETYYWSKHREFLKFIDLPTRTSQPLELALGRFEPADQEMLEQHGWSVVPAAAFSSDLDAYRAYVGSSHGEFTVAKDQNVRLRTGWFSDRSASYLAAGRPVINQETGFSNTYPIGEGLFAFSTVDEIVDAVDRINSDYARHRRAAADLAREFFGYDVVLPALLASLDL